MPCSSITISKVHGQWRPDYVLIRYHLYQSPDHRGGLAIRLKIKSEGAQWLGITTNSLSKVANMDTGVVAGALGLTLLLMPLDSQWCHL